MSRAANVAALGSVALSSSLAFAQATPPGADPTAPGVRPEDGADRQGSGVFLSWVRSASASACVDGSAVQADVVRRLGWSPFSDPVRRSIEVSVFRRNGVWRADIQLRDRDGSSLGSRRVTSGAASCDSLAAAAALAIALLIDPDAVLSDPSAPKDAPPEPSPEPAPAPEAQTVEPPPPALVPERRATASVDRGHGSFLLAAAGAARLLPEFAPGLALRTEVRAWGRLSVVVSGMLLPEVRAVRSGTDAAFGLTYAEVGPCYELVSDSPFGFAACVSLLVGALHAVVSDPEPVDVGQRWWWAAAGGFRTQWAFSRPFTIGGGVAAVLPQNRRDNVTARGTAESVSIFNEPGIGVVGWIGAGVQF